MSATFLLITVLVVAASLRAAITSVGPLLTLIGNDTHLSKSALGLLGAIPLAAFAIVSPLVQLLVKRFGTERAVLLALVVLTAATVLRSIPGWDGWLWIGTAIIGAAIAVGNVLLPTIVKRDFPNHVAAATGGYVAVLSGFAALASGIALPLGNAFGWRISVGAGALLSLIGAIVWLPRLRHQVAVKTAAEPPSPGSMWRAPVAWWVAMFFAAQMANFYLLITWLPTIEKHTGQSAVAGGWHLFVFQAAGIVGGLLIPRLMRGRADLRAVSTAVALTMVVAMVGLLFAPALVVLWAIVGGMSAGAALVVGLTFIAARARHTTDAGRLSGMAQSLGYALAMVGPILAGYLLDKTNAWQAPVLLVLVIAVLQLIVGLFAGRDRHTHPAQ
ncbi:MAG: MFS transporter [Burkholderiaceae bacterium]|nr:MFS transporter [Pseudomonadota bacterium]MBS0597374.1 MFS transporter [Pseudomonadota bacterium]MCP5218023.1 MFS transporter [Burkholderiaceae bacterium]